MKIKYIISGLSALMATSLSVANELHDWQFNDPAGTTVSGALNQGSVGVPWDGNLANSTTTGTGILRIMRSGNLVSRRADVGDIFGVTEIHMVAEIAGWHMPVVNDTVTTELRWELLNGTTLNSSTQVTAGFRMFFLDTGEVTLETGAGGTDSNRREATPIFTRIQNEPVTIALSYDLIFSSYVVQYKVGDGEWVEFFEGNVAPDRSPVSFRFAIRGDFNGDGENYFDLDRFVISTAFPPSPQDDPPPPPVTIPGNLHDWRFMEAEGTVLSEAFNAMDPEVKWDGNLSDSATTGNGTFRIQRNGTLINRRMDILDTRNSTDYHMQVDIAGWDLRHVDDLENQPEIRFEFINAPAEEDSVQITAGMRLSRLEDGSVAMQGVAGGLAAPGGLESEILAVFDSLQEGPLSIRTSYDSKLHSYGVYYRFGAGDWTEFFLGTTSGVRSAVSWRMSLRGDFNGGGLNYFDIDRFVISNVFPASDRLWDLLEVEDGSKATFLGRLYDTHYPWVFHQSSRSWLYVFPGTSSLGNGMHIYHPGFETWMWTRADLGGWLYDLGTEAGWTYLTQ
jgi:hypothetical protein